MDNAFLRITTAKYVCGGRDNTKEVVKTLLTGMLAVRRVLRYGV